MMGHPDMMGHPEMGAYDHNMLGYNSDPNLPNINN
jgi:hypothetical protein